MPTISLSGGRRFVADPGASILEAARSRGIILEYSCRTGRCGVCKVAVVSGATEPLRPEIALSPEEAQEGVILTCCRTATSDVALDTDELGRLADIETRTLPARIATIEVLARDVVRVLLRLPPAANFFFLPGQYIDILAAGVRRSYSLAAAARPDGQLELFIKRIEAGVLSRFWFETAKPGDLVRFEGPLGTFFLRETRPVNLLFLATGTGIAPVKALVEELAADPVRARDHRVAIYWGNRTAEAFFWEPSPQLGLDLRFVPLVSAADPSWTGRRGYVHDAAVADGFDSADTVVYACGSSTMIADAQSLLGERGLPRNRFFSDAFVSSS